MQTKKMVTAQGKTWHPEHFNCTECGKILPPNNFFEKNGLPYCEDDFHKLFSAKCAGCGGPIKDVMEVYSIMSHGAER
jgi:paxillin